MRTSALLSFLLLLCSTSTTVTARKLRGTRAASRRLNHEKLLFTEGRKGGDAKDKVKNDSGDGYWTSEDGDAAIPSYDGGSDDRPAMKTSDDPKTKTKDKDKEIDGDSEDAPALKTSATKGGAAKTSGAKGAPSPPAKGGVESATKTKGTKTATADGAKSEDEPVAKQKESGKFTCFIRLGVVLRTRIAFA